MTAAEFEEITAAAEAAIEADPAPPVIAAEAAPVAKKRGRPPNVSPVPKKDEKIEPDPDPPVIAAEAVPVAKKRGRPPKGSPVPKKDAKIEPTPVDQHALLNSLAELIRRNDVNVYNATMDLYKSFLSIVK